MRLSKNYDIELALDPKHFIISIIVSQKYSFVKWCIAYGKIKFFCQLYLS